MWFWVCLRGKRVKTLCAVISETKEKKKKRVIHDCHFVTNKLNFPINIFYIHSVSSSFSSSVSFWFSVGPLHSLSSARTQLIIVMLSCLFSSFFAFCVFFFFTVFYQDCLYVIEKWHSDCLSRDDWAVIWKWFVLWMLLSQTFNWLHIWALESMVFLNEALKNVIELKRRFEVATEWLFGDWMRWNETYYHLMSFQKKNIHHKWTISIHWVLSISYQFWMNIFAQDAHFIAKYKIINKNHKLQSNRAP